MVNGVLQCAHWGKPSSESLSWSYFGGISIDDGSVWLSLEVSLVQCILRAVRSSKGHWQLSQM